MSRRRKLLLICALALGAAAFVVVLVAGPEVAHFLGDTFPRKVENLGQVLWSGGMLHLPNLFVGACLGAFVVVLALLVRERWAAIPRPVLGGLVGLTGLALVLRLTLSPRTFLHEYYHVNELWLNTFIVADRPTYGLTGPIIYRAANALVGGEERAMFLADALIASLTVPVAALFTRALFGSWTRALLAGLVVCLLPVHLRFSASEELWIPAAFLALVSLTAWTLWLRRPTAMAMAVAILALALGDQTRPELLPLPLMHAGLLFAIKPPREWIRTIFNRQLLVGALALPVLLVFRLSALIEDRGTMPRQELPNWWMLTSTDTLVDWTVMPRALVAAAVVALVWGLWRHTRLTLWMLAFIAMYLVIPLSAFQNRPCIYRTQMFTAMFVAMSAAGAIELVPNRIAWRSVAAALIAVVCIQGLWTRRGFVTGLADQQLEFAFLDEVVPQLPDRAKMIGLFRDTSYVSNRPDWFGDFPSFLFGRDHKAVDETDIRVLGDTVPWPPASPGLIYYQGMYCYVSGAADVPLYPMRPECTSVRQRYELKPLVTRTLDTTGYSTAFYGSPPYEIGFYEVTGPRAGSTNTVKG